MKKPMNNASGLHILLIGARSLIKTRAICRLAVLCLCLAPLYSQAREAPLPDLETMNRLRLGEIVVEAIRVDEKGGAVKASLMIWAPSEGYLGDRVFMRKRLYIPGGSGSL